MIEHLEPLQADSLKDVFTARFEELILSGKLAIGEKLPSERELALQLGVSRPVVHEGLVELAARGLVSIKPRSGTIINDFRREGSLALLNSLISHRGGQVSPEMLESLLSLRRLIEMETARLAASHATAEDINVFNGLISQERALDTSDVAGITAVDFTFHHRVALASGNLVYPLLIKSVEPAYTLLAGAFFSLPGVVPTVWAFHADLVAAFASHDADAAVQVMERLLDHGRLELNKTLGRTVPPLSVEGHL